MLGCSCFIICIIIITVFVEDERNVEQIVTLKVIY